VKGDNNYKRLWVTHSVIGGRVRLHAVADHAKARGGVIDDQPVFFETAPLM
jgi:hypothetical protein